MATHTHTTIPSLGDRYSEFTVIALTLIALLIGWGLKTSVENRSVAFTGGNITAQTPAGWLQSTPRGDEVLRATDPASSGFGTTYVVRNIPITSDATAAQTASLLAIEHSQNLTAFRVLSQRDVTVMDKPAYEMTYVFVESNPDITHNELPTVVRGVDYTFLNGDHAVVATFWADEKTYALDMGRFYQFLTSIRY